SRACSVKAVVVTLAPPAAAKKSARCLSRPIGTSHWPASGAEPLASMRPALGQHFAPAFGRHARAETVTALAHQLARLIGPLHGCFSAAARGRPWTGRCGAVAPHPENGICGGRRCFSSPAAYRGTGLTRQCKRQRRCGRSRVSHSVITNP